MKKSKTVKKKRYINAQFVWLLSCLAAVLFLYSFHKMPMFPTLWTVAAGLGLLVILFLTLKLSTRFQKSHFVKFLNSLLCFVLTVCAVLMPVYEKKLTEIFDNMTGYATTINLYVMNETYRSEHSELFGSTEVSDNLNDYLDGVFITSVKADAVNAAEAVAQIKKEYSADITTTDRDNYPSAVEALYNNEGDVLIMSGSFVSMITEDENYQDFKDNVKLIATFRKESDSLIPKATASITREPFIVFFGGNDEFGDLYLEGKTDVDMIVTVNPNTHQIAIVSLPRDSYIDNPAFGWGDKLTHLGLQGIQNTLAGLGDYLGHKINNYVVINFRTFREIINALGGVYVYNEYEFTALDGQYYPEGWIRLVGEYALMFVRERYSLYDGDFGRNHHQQQVMQAIIEKITSPEVIVHIDSILEALNGTFLTNLSSDAIYAFCRKQLGENIDWNIVSYHVLGDIGYAECASSPGMELSVVYPYDNQVEFVSQVMKDVISGETVEQQELPYGEYYDIYSGY